MFTAIKKRAAGCGNYGKRAGGAGAHQAEVVFVLYFSANGPRVCVMSFNDGTLQDMGAWPVPGGYAIDGDGSRVCLNDVCGLFLGHAYALYGDMGVGPDLGLVTTNAQGQAALTLPAAKTAAGCGNVDPIALRAARTAGSYGGSSGASRVDGPFVTPFASNYHRPGASPYDIKTMGYGLGNQTNDAFDPFNIFEALQHDPVVQYTLIQPQLLQEVHTEPDVAKYASGATRFAGRPKRLFAAGPGDDQTAIVQTGIWPAFQNGGVDTIGWTQIPVNEYQIMVTDEPLSVSGLRLPTNMLEEILISNALQALPITKVVSDARWANAVNRQTFSGLGDPRGAVINDPGQVIAWNAKFPQTGQFSDGYWKEGVLVAGLQQFNGSSPSVKHSLAQYGGRQTMDPNSPTVQGGLPGPHDQNYKDYSNTPTYMGRNALKNGVTVDLLDELAAGCSLGGPIPEWLVAKFRGGNS